MSDLIERLRNHSERAVEHWEDYANATDSIVVEAAAAIVAKDAEIASLRDALEPLAFAKSSLNFDRFDEGNTAWVAVDGAGSDRVYFFVGDVIRARAALKDATE